MCMPHCKICLGREKHEEDPKATSHTSCTHWMLRKVRDTAPKDSKYLLELSSSTNLLVPWCSFCIYLAPSVNVGIFMCKPLYVTTVLEEMQNIKNDIACLFFPFVFFYISFHMLCCVKENRILQFFFFCFLFSTRKKKKEKKRKIALSHKCLCCMRLPVDPESRSVIDFVLEHGKHTAEMWR